MYAYKYTHTKSILNVYNALYDTAKIKYIKNYSGPAPGLSG